MASFAFSRTSPDGNACRKRKRISTSKSQREANGFIQTDFTAGVTRKSLAPHWVSYTARSSAKEIRVAATRPKSVTLRTASDFASEQSVPGSP